MPDNEGFDASCPLTHLPFLQGLHDLRLLCFAVSPPAQKCGKSEAVC